MERAGDRLSGAGVRGAAATGGAGRRQAGERVHAIACRRRGGPIHDKHPALACNARHAAACPCFGLPAASTGSSVSSVSLQLSLGDSKPCSSTSPTTAMSLNGKAT